MKPRILVVEDEPSILDDILSSLETDGFAPLGCATGEAAREAMKHEEFALVDPWVEGGDSRRRKR